MRLRWSPASPFTRKVVVAASELGLLEQIECVLTLVAERSPDFLEDNPLAKIPVLICEDGTRLFESRVICEYLDSLRPSPQLFPPIGPARWEALRQQALADGLMDAALLIRYEERRDSSLQSASWISDQMGRVNRVLEKMESEELGADRPTIGPIAIAVALSYLDFRFLTLDWRTTHKRLAAWYAAFSKRPSMELSALREKGKKTS
jgi:glutathione S-transferase